MQLIGASVNISTGKQFCALTHRAHEALALCLGAYKTEQRDGILNVVEAFCNLTAQTSCTSFNPTHNGTPSG